MNKQMLMILAQTLNMANTGKGYLTVTVRGNTKDVEYDITGLA